MSRKYFLHGSIEYHPDSGELFVGDKVENLQSLENKLLLHFVTHPDELISKEQLYDVGWNGRIYGDNPLSKAISNIRSKLGDSPKSPKFIKTIPKKGFRFISTVAEQQQASVNPVQVADDSKQAKTHFSPNFLTRSVITGIAGAGMIWLAFNLMSQQSQLLSPQKIDHIKQLTHSTAQERQPNITNDGELVVFSRTENADSLSQLILKPINGAPELQLTDNEFNNLSPKFHRDGRRILYHRVAQQRCEIALIELDNKLNVISDIMLASCSKHSQALGISWGPGNSIYYTDIDIQFAPMSIYKLDIDSGKRSLVVKSNDIDGRGYYRVHYDDISNNLYALLSVGWFNTQVITMDLSGAIKEQHLVNMPLFSVSSYNGHPVFRTADNHFRYLQDNQAKLLMQSPLWPVFGPSFSNGQTPQLAFVGGEFNNTQLLQVDLDNRTEQVLLDTQVNNRHPVMSQSGNLYFISNASGIYQIWRRNGEQNQQISQFRDNHFIDGMVISADERYLAVVVNENTYAFLLDNTPLKLNQPYLLVEKSINPHFSPDNGTLWVSHKQSNSYQLASYSLSNKKPLSNPIQHGYLGVFDRQTQQHLVFKYEQPGVWTIEQNQLKWLANAPLATAINSIDVSNNLMTHFDDAEGALMQVNLLTGQQKVLAKQPYRFFTKINNHSNQWIVTLRTFGNTDVFLTKYVE